METTVNVKVGDRFWKYADQKPEDRTDCFVQGIVDKTRLLMNDRADFLGFSIVNNISDLVLSDDTIDDDPRYSDKGIWLG